MQYAEDKFKDNTMYIRNDEFRAFVEDNPGSYCKSASMFYDWMRDFGEFKGWTCKDAGHGSKYMIYGEPKDELPLKDDAPF